MTAITQDEVRRHPRWREELRLPTAAPTAQRQTHGAILAVVALLLGLAVLAFFVWR